MAGFIELNLDQGTNFSTVITLADDTYGTPINVVGANISSQIRKSPYSVNATATFSCNVSDGANGVITMSLNANTTSNISAGRYVFDTKMTTANGMVSRILEGIISVSPSVTR